MPVSFRVSDGPAATPWLSPDIEPGTLQTSGTFTIVPTLQTGQRYDFRLMVHNDGNEVAIPWNDNTATGDFAAVSSGASGIAWPLSGTGRTIATSGGTRVQLVQAGGFYDLELQTSSGTLLHTLESTLDPNQSDIRVGVVYSLSGRYLAWLRFRAGWIPPSTSGTVDVTVSVVLAQPLGALPAGRVLLGPSSTAPSQSIFVYQGSFVAQAWSNSVYAGLSFGFAPSEQSFWATWRDSTAFDSYSLLDLREVPYQASRAIFSQRSSGRQFGQFRFSPGGDVLALIPQVSETVELYEVPSGLPMVIAYNGTDMGTVTVTAATAKLTTVSPTSYGGITLTGMSSSLSNGTAIDPPFRARCAAQVHFWVAVPSGVGDENASGNIKLPASVNKQGASAYLARVPRMGSQDVVVVSQYLAPAMMGPADHRCAFAEAYSVANARPFEGKQRTGSAFAPLSFAQVGQRNLTILPPNSPYFVAPYAIGNFGTKPVDITLSVRTLNVRRLSFVRVLAGLERYGQLKVKAVGFIDYPCGMLVGRREVMSKPRLKVTLAPGEERRLAVLIDVDREPNPRVLDLAAFNVIERRSDGSTGGVTVVAASNPNLIPSVDIPEPPTACPVSLVRDVYWSETRVAPAKGAQRFVPAGRAGHLAAEIVNVSGAALTDFEVWVESHSLAATSIEPLVIQSIRLEPGESLFAAWPIDAGVVGNQSGVVSIVAQSAKTTPKRLRVEIAVTDRPVKL